MHGKILASICVGLAILLHRDLLNEFLHPHPLSRVAVINYSDLVTDNPSTDSSIFSSMVEYGFFFVSNIPEFRSAEELEYLEMFFDLPKEVKMELAVRKHSPHSSNVYRGYGPVVGGTGTQFKEMFNIGPHETGDTEAGDQSSNRESTECVDAMEKFRIISKEGNLWPRSGNDTFDRKFKGIFQAGLKTRQTIASSVVRSIGRSLGHPELIDRFTESEFSTLGLRKYPIREEVRGEMNSAFDNVTLSELEHEDSTVTILTTFNYTGLQVFYQNKYWDVPPTGDNFIVNIGALIEDIADNRIMAVRHRVRQVDFVRHSIPYFFNPSFDADISRSISGRPTKAGATHKVFGEWMRNYLPAVEPGILNDEIAH